MKPHLCPDKDCKRVWSNYSKDSFDRGASYTCWGKMTKPHLFIERETEHVNPYSYCVYTPLKGHIRFFVNSDDAWSDHIGSGAIMDDADQLVCDECGPMNRVGNTLHIFPDGPKLCSKCSVRIGKLKWNEEEKRYW